MGPRRKSREFALEILYQMDVQGQGLDVLLTVLNDYWSYKPKKYKDEVFKEVQEFTALLVKGVLQHLAELDQTIAQYLTHWTIDQISPIDKNIMRMALYEMLHMKDVPFEVTINEAIEVAKKYGAQESHHFVNGILDRIYKNVLQAS